MDRPIALALLILVAGCGRADTSPQHLPQSSTSYDDLLSLFRDWRQFESSPFSDGVHDYSPAAMAAQHRNLAAYQQRLAAIAPSGWSIPQLVDHELVRAEMNGLDFDHRVRRPWARNPAFYFIVHPAQSDVPAHEGPFVHGGIDIWKYDFPLSRQDAAELQPRFESIAPLLEQARYNLVEDARDLWRGGIRAMKGQSATLASLSTRVEGELRATVEEARAATDAFVTWLEAELPSKNGPSGVGRDNYTWYLNNVHLVRYTWEEEVTLIRRELARSHASLRLEENRNRNLAALVPYQSAEEYDRQLSLAVTEFMEFLEEAEIVSIRDYMDAALRARVGSFSPAEGLRGFFSEVNYRDGVVMRTHGYHWFDLARMEREPHASPIRQVASLYNIFDGRSEGMATGVEEMLMQAGLFDDKPRSRELIWIMLAQRAARALSGLYMHANRWTIDEAVEFASEWTPRGWMPPDSETVWGEQHFYLQQPGYETSYLIGKIEIEQLMAERALALGDSFTIKGFFDEFDATGIIPVSLARWELTGDGEQVRGMLGQ